MERIPEKFLEFEIDFNAYLGKVFIRLRETFKKKNETFRTSRIIAESSINLKNLFGFPKSKTSIKTSINKLKNKMLGQYLYNEKRLKHLEEIVYDETEGKYHLRSLKTSLFIERLR
jgi:hypothetical protein